MNSIDKKYKFSWLLYAGFLIMPIMMVSCLSSKKTAGTSYKADSTASQSNQTVLTDTKSNQQVAFQHSSETIEPSRIVSKTIEFANGNTLDVFQGERYAESPGGQRHAVLKFGNVGDSLTDLSIYDNNGNKLSESKVAPMDKIAIADDGRFVVYGFEPTCNVAFISNLFCYDKNGNNVFIRKNSFGIYHKAVYAPDSDLFVFWASSKDFSKAHNEETILVFDKDYQLLGETILKNSAKFSKLETIEIDGINKQIVLHRINNKDGLISKEQSILNLQGEIIK